MFVKAGTTILQALLLVCVFALVQPGNVRANPIFNNSFEDGLNGWSSNADGRFGRNAEPSAYDGLPTDGTTSGRIFSQTWSTFAAGQFGSLSQTVDLSGIQSITFDIVLRQIGLDSDGVWSPFLEAAFLIDGPTGGPQMPSALTSIRRSMYRP